MPLGTPQEAFALQSARNGVDSTRPQASQLAAGGPAERPPAHQPPAEPLPGDPAYIPHAVVRFAPLLDRMGMSEEQREPFLRGLSALVDSALDAYFAPVDANAEHRRPGGHPRGADLDADRSS